MKEFVKDFEILLVDVDRIINLLHSRILDMSQVGFTYTAFLTAEAALDYMEAKMETGVQFLILLDINMPQMNGWEFLEECRARKWEQLFVVLVTSSIDPRDKKRRNKYDRVLSLVEKPLNLQKIMTIFELPELCHLRGGLPKNEI